MRVRMGMRMRWSVGVGGELIGRGSSVSFVKKSAFLFRVDGRERREERRGGDVTWRS